MAPSSSSSSATTILPSSSSPTVPALQPSQSLRRRLNSCLLFWVPVSLLLLTIRNTLSNFSSPFSFSLTSTSTSTSTSPIIHPTIPDGGHCSALGTHPRLPPWIQSVSREHLKSELSHFSSAVYARRPFRPNDGGMQLDHSFALWYTLRSLNPTPRVVIESGARRGHTTWLIREALSDTRVFSLSPEKPSIRAEGNVSYFVGDDFVDFGDMAWREQLPADIVKSMDKDVVVLIDDHQNAYRRLFDEGAAFGFKRFVFDDNYQYLHGDTHSVKWMCEVNRSPEWRGYIPDNMGKLKIPVTWEAHLDMGRKLDRDVKYYLEFPPVVAQNVTGGKRYNEQFSTAAIITERDEAMRVIGEENIKECMYYTHICYIELK